MPAPVVTLTTDFGTADGYAAAVKGVLLSAAPEATVVDLSHDLPPHDVIAGAWLLLRAVPFFPAGTVHLGVVDPGVGGPRRALLLHAGGQYFVGPDNGLFSLAARRLGGAERAVALDRRRFPTPGTSAVFDGRDLFAPAAAALARAVAAAPEGSAPDVTRWGDPVGEWERLPWAEPRREREAWVGEVVHVDRFGNAVTNLTPRHGAGPLEIGGRRVPRGRAYVDVSPGAPVALEGSSGFLEIALNGAPAAARLGLTRGTAVRLGETSD